jgi:RND family efflux transporter MFP subunit
MASVAVAAQAAPAQMPVSVPTLTVGAGMASAGFTLEGTLQAQQQVTVAAQTNGRVLVLAVKAGDRVKAGQLLARIDDRDLQLGVVGGEASVAQAQAVWVQAEQNASRSQALRSQGFLSAAAVDTATAQLQAAQAALQQAKALRGQATLARGHATVTAPFDGIVLATQVDAGDLATPGRALLTLYSPQRLRAVVQLPASRSAAARAAQRVDITLPNGQTQQATLRTELPSTDGVSQTVEWRLDLPAAASAGLQPGLPVQVRFVGGGASAAPAGLVIPATAVLRRGELTAVYAVQGDRFVLKAVRLGSPQGDGVAVLAGLKADERIASDPVRAGMVGAQPTPR